MKPILQRNKFNLTIVIERDGKWMAAHIKELPEVITQGESVEEVLENLADAMRELEAAKKDISKGKVA